MGGVMGKRSLTGFLWLWLMAGPLNEQSWLLMGEASLCPMLGDASSR